MFVWGASVYFALARMPDQALDVYAVGKQWMWKFQHREGQREINELHVPVNTPIRVIMTSEDVLHDLYFPSFRTKIDAHSRAGTRSSGSTPPKSGTYHIFCAEYCGTRHSGHDRPRGRDAAERLRGLARRSCDGRDARRSAARSCSRSSPASPATAPTAQGRGPLLNGVFGHAVSLANGNTVIADAAYVRESILNPHGEGRRRLRAHHADLPGASHRGAAPRAHRIHQVAADVAAGAGRASHAAADCAGTAEVSNGHDDIRRGHGGHARPPLPERAAGHQELAAHDRPQADRVALPVLDHRLLLPRRVLRAADPAAAADARPAT